MNNYKIALVSPCHIQPSEKWVKAVDDLDIPVIIVDDSADGVHLVFPLHWDVYDKEAQKDVLGDKYEYFTKFQKSSSCKNFGHYKAYVDGYDIIIGLDSDCIPYSRTFVQQHIANLEKDSFGWENPLQIVGWFSRGFPYSKRKLKTALSLGLWNNELDLYGKDRIDNPSKQTSVLVSTEPRVAQGFIPLSGMNWATRRENIPRLLFLPNHADYRRHDDIWGGYIFQKGMFARNERIVYGNPVVYHDTVVNAEEDAKEEEAMIQDEDSFFVWVEAGMPLVHNSIKWDWVLEAYQWWQSLYV